jgi:hypothetical protein
LRAQHWAATEEFLASLSKAQIFAALDEAKFNWKSVKADLQEGRAGEARSARTRQGEVAAEGAEGVSGDGTVGLGRVMGADARHVAVRMIGQCGRRRTMQFYT